MVQKLLVLLVVILACEAKTDSTGCPESFLGKCKCGRERDPYDTNATSEKKIVKCLNAGFTSATMLKDIPEDTEVLIFKGNRIHELPLNVFDNTKDYDKLETIDLSNNHIRIIRGKTFHKVYNVNTLILDHNDIDISDQYDKPRLFSNFENLERLHLTNAFTEDVNASEYLLSLEDIFYESDLGLLKVLHLEQNEIWSFKKTDDKVFSELTSLEQLMLGDNKLIDFDFDIERLANLRYVDLERNMISRFSEEAMKRLDDYLERRDKKELTINLENNPFNCDCLFDDFLSWIKTTEVKVKDWENYLCIDGYPQTNVELTFKTFAIFTKKVKAGEVHDLRCPGIPRIPGIKEAHLHYSPATVGVLSFLLVFTSSLLVAVAYFQRKKLKGVLLPYWDFVTRKIGYTGISNEEAPQEVNV